MPDTYDVVVLGAGPAGENVADYATEGSDLTAVLIERELLGGECSYWACMPSKALLRPIEVANTTEHLDGVAKADVLVPGLLRRRDEWVSSYDDSGQADWARDAGLDVVRGEARIAGPRRVIVRTADGERTIEARRCVVLATGSEAVVPEMYAACAPWGSRDATGIVEVPARTAVIGGGVVACEAAVWLAAMGSHVTLLVRDDRLLARVEPWAADLVREGLESAGIDVRLGASITGATRDRAEDTGLGRIHGGPVTLTVDGEDLISDELLVAVGRRPRLDDLGLESADLTPDDVTSGNLPDWLLAVGDASGEAPLTHWGKYRARVLGEQIASGSAPAVPDDVPVPQVVFTAPQIAAVGATEAEAREAGHDVVIAKVPWTGAAGAALLRDDADGAAQLVVDRRTGLLLGATFVGPEVAELLHAATVAIVGAVLVRVLRHAVPSYPTASELWLRLLEELPRELR